MINWSKLWNVRHEPVSVLVSIAVLLVAATTIFLTINQVIIRGAPIVCGSQYFPEEKEDCEEIQDRVSLPIGTIVAFFGLDTDIPEGWIVCAGQPIPDNSLLSIDANAKKPGKQLPDLKGRFVRGSNESLDGSQLLTGGDDTISFNHSHLWSEFHALEWYSYNAAGSRFRVDDWVDGIDNEGNGNYPLLTRESANAKLYTRAFKQTTDNRPAYVELRYIIKIF